jgi:hypothetical protein
MDNNNPISDEERRQISEALNNATRSSGSAIRDLGDASKRASFAAESAKDGLDKIGQGAIQFSQSLVGGKDGLDKYGSAVESAASGVGDLLMATGPLGAAFGILAKIVGAVVGTVLKTDQKLLDGYDKLADIGGAAGLTTDSLRELADKANAASTTDRFGKFIDIVHGMGGDLLALGKTSSDGMKKFSEIAAVGNATRTEFLKLGISQEKLTQIQAGYIQNQVKSGTFQTRTSKDLQKESLDYATRLVELSSLTGQKIDKIQQDQADDLKNLDFLLAIRKLEQSGNTEQANKIKDLMTRMGEHYGPEARTAFRQAYSSVINNGVVIGDQANEMSQTFVQGGESLQKAIQDLEKGTLSEDQFLKMYNKSLSATERNLGAALVNTEGVAKSVGVYGDALTGQSKENADGQTERTKAEVEAAKKRKDPAMESQAKLQNFSNDLSKAFDTFVGFISNFVNKGFQALMYGFKMLAKGFVKLLDSSLFRVMGYKADNDLTYMFDSADELVARLNETTKGISDSKAIIAKEKAKTTGYDAQAVLMAEDRIKSLTKTEKDVRDVMGRMFDTKDVDKVIKERQEAKEIEAKKAELEKRNAEQPAAPAATSKGTVSEPAAIKIGAGTSTGSNQTAAPAESSESGGQLSGPDKSVGPEQSKKSGGLTRDPYEAIGSAPSDYNAKIPLPSGVSIPATVKLPADMTSTRKSLLTESNDINGILSNYMDALSNNMNSMADTVIDPNKTKSVTNNILELFSTKMDNLLDRMNENTDLQNEMLMYSKR